MNKVVISGALTKDIELRTMGDGKAVTKFSLAVKRMNDTADFISCTAFGQTAELLNKCVKKGSRLLLEGRIQTGSYTNAEGRTVYTTDVVVDRVEFMDKKSESTTDNRSNSEIIREVATSGYELPF